MSDFKYTTLVNDFVRILANERKVARADGQAGRADVISDIYGRFASVVDSISADILPDIAEVDWQTIAIEPEDETLADVVDRLVSTVNLEGEIVDGADDRCPFEGECNTWQHLFGCVYDYVQQGVEDAESGGFDGELPAYRVILAYMRGLLDANGVDSIG